MYLIKQNQYKQLIAPHLTMHMKASPIELCIVRTQSERTPNPRGDVSTEIRDLRQCLPNIHV